MSVSKKQKELDIIKWEKSQKIGKDACGTFDYCIKCDKAKENPCEKAYNAFNKKPVAKKPIAKKEVAVTSVKKPVAKKPAQKKTAKPVVKK